MNTEQLQSLTIDGFTTPCPICVNMSTTIFEVLETMAQEKVRHLPVLDDEARLVGVVSERDVAKFDYFREKLELPVSDVMSFDPQTVPVGTTIIEASYLLSKHKIGSLIVTESDGSIAGIFTTTDALNSIVECLRGDILETTL